MTRTEALAILDDSLLACEAATQDYLGRQEPLLAEVMEDSRRGLIKLREAIWQKLNEDVLA